MAPHIDTEYAYSGGSTTSKAMLSFRRAGSESHIHAARRDGFPGPENMMNSNCSYRRGLRLHTYFPSPRVARCRHRALPAMARTRPEKQSLGPVLDRESTLSDKTHLKRISSTDSKILWFRLTQNASRAFLPELLRMCASETPSHRKSHLQSA